MAKRPINLNRARKRRARAEKERVAETNRRWHGLPGGERERLEQERERAKRTLGGKRLEPPQGEDAGDATGGEDEGASD